MKFPETRYISRDGISFAYQLVGDKSINVLWFLEINNHLDLMWTDPHMHYLLERGVSYAKTAYFQPRGFGLSDSVRTLPTFDQQMNDVLAVMDAAGMQSATLVGIFGTCGPLAGVAAAFPERVDKLILVNPVCRGPMAKSREVSFWQDDPAVEEFIEGYKLAFEQWGSGNTAAMWDTRLNSEFNRRLMSVLERGSATPASARAYFESILYIDLESVLRQIKVDTRILSVPTSPMPKKMLVEISDAIRGADVYELPWTPLNAEIGEAFIPVFDYVEFAATGSERPVHADRTFGCLMFTDVVDSTRILSLLGDERYSELRSQHERDVRHEVELHGGRVISVVGDGTCSVFDHSKAAVRCSRRVSDISRSRGIPIRAGLHVGESVKYAQDLTGLTVHLTARICASAGLNEIFVSREVVDSLVGTDFTVESRGSYRLKGIKGARELFAIVQFDVI